MPKIHSYYVADQGFKLGKLAPASYVTMTLCSPTFLNLYQKLKQSPNIFNSG